MAHGLSCSAARGIFETVSPALAGGFLTTVPPGKSQIACLLPFTKDFVERNVWEVAFSSKTESFQGFIY